MFKISQSIFDKQNQKSLSNTGLRKNFCLALFFFAVILKNTMDVLLLTTQRTENI